MLVAIKMLEHVPGVDMLKQAERVEREALLTTSLIHPNVITTFEVSTMSGSTAHSLRAAGSGDTDWSAANLARMPSVLQQPGSIRDGNGSGHCRSMNSADALDDNGVAGSRPGSAQGMPRDLTTAEHGGSMHLCQSPCGHAGGPAEVEHNISSSPLGTGRSGSSSQDGALAVAEEPSFDSAADNAGRRPGILLANEGGDSSPPKDVVAEDDEEEIQERCTVLASI